MSGRDRRDTSGSSGDGRGRGGGAGRGPRRSDGRRDGERRTGGPQRGSGRPADRQQGSGRAQDGRAGGRSRQSGERDRPNVARRDRDGDRAGRSPSRESAPAEKPSTAVDPAVDDDVTGRELDPQIRNELSALSGGAAAAVSRHLVMAQRLLHDDPQLAYEHSMAARRRAGRIGVVREAAGVAAYMAGHYAEALAELRAARRMTGSAEYLPMMADCERGLGRPRRALQLAEDPAVAGLDKASRVEMLIVAAGARRDLGEHEAAAVALHVPELRAGAGYEWVARLRYAYADALLAAGRDKEAQRWFMRAAEADLHGETDAEERATALSVDESTS